MTNKGLISNIYQWLIQLNIEKKKTVKKGEEELNRYFSKEEIQMANKHMDTQYYQSLGKYKSRNAKAQHDITSHLSEWLSLKRT